MLRQAAVDFQGQGFPLARLTCTHKLGLLPPQNLNVLFKLRGVKALFQPRLLQERFSPLLKSKSYTLRFKVDFFRSMTSVIQVVYAFIC